MSKKRLLVMLTLALLWIGGMFLCVAPATFAANQFDGTETLVLGNESDNGEGNGIFDLLALILNIFTIGVGILGTFGIALSGFLYITSKDDPSKMAAAKSRLFNVILGLGVYAIIWTVLQFVIPGGIFGTRDGTSGANGGSGGSSVVTDEGKDGDESSSDASGDETSSDEAASGEIYAEGSTLSSDGTRVAPYQEGWANENGG